MQTPQRTHAIRAQILQHRAQARLDYTQDRFTPQKRLGEAWSVFLPALRRLRPPNPKFFDTRSIAVVGEFANNIGGSIRATTPRRKLLCSAGVGLVCVSAWFMWYWTNGRYIETTDDAYVGGEVTTLSFKVPGLIETVAIIDNQPVKAGDLLLRLDDRDYRAQLARAEANIAARRAALVNVDATRRMRVSMLGQARADLAAAMAERVRAKFDIDRYRVLNNDRFASRQRFELADADNEKAVASENKAQAALEAAEHQLDIVDAQREQAVADLEQAIADHDLARLNLSYAEIRSPIDGVVGNRSARVGAYATVGAQVLAIVPAHGLWVDANFREGQLAGMRKGQPAEIIADVIPDVTFRGHVDSLSPATGAQFSVLPPENATGNFTKIVQRVPVRIRLENDAAELGQLRPGLSVFVRVDERQSGGGRVDERQKPNPDDRRQGTPVRDEKGQRTPPSDHEQEAVRHAGQ
jgi:membrane fusion protein (multidrug efflux system)